MKTLKVSKPRRRVPRQSSGLFDELVMDYFAGGGGASLGIERALGRAVDVAINHDAAAISMHSTNHPHTLHYCEDVWKVNPRKASGGRRVGMAWFSPDCRHFSRTKGSKPVKKNIRGLAWVVVRTAKAVKPRVIFLENVREFEDWGPLVHLQGTPPSATELLTCTLPAKDRAKFKLGFKYTKTGEPVYVPDGGRKGETFKRFVRELRNAGYHVEWRVLNAADYGAPTHRRRLFLVARCDGRPIVWPEPTHGPGRKPYKTAADCIDWTIPCPSIFGRKKPLAEKTMRRIALGIKRYVLDNPKPFIVPLTHHGDRRVHTMDEPVPTVTGANRGELALVSPHIIKFRGECNGVPANEPMPTITSGAGSVRPAGAAHAMGVVQAFLAPYLVECANSNWSVGARPADEAAPTVTARPKGGSWAIVAPHLTKFYGTNVGSDMRDAVPTVTATGQHVGAVYAFLVKYFGTAIGCPADEPLHTATAKPRFGLVIVMVDGEPYVIADIGLRMLTPRELARAQGFPDSYVLTGTKSNQVARIGNSVCPVMAEVLVRANVVEG